MDEREYRAMPAINASAIAAGMTSMRHMRHVMTGGAKKDTPAMQWGRKVHAAILTPTEFFAGVKIWEGASKRGKAWDKFKAENADDMDMVCTHAEMAALAEMSKSVWGNYDARHCLEFAQTEQVVTWDDPEVGKCKMRYDALNGSILSDLKTTANILPDAFWRTGYNLGYHVKMGWYARGIHLGSGPRPAARIIVLENAAPYDCWVCKMPDSIVEEGEKLAVETARLYRACEASNIFPGAVDGLVDYELPGWVDVGNEVDMEGVENE